MDFLNFPLIFNRNQKTRSKKVYLYRNQKKQLKNSKKKHRIMKIMHVCMKCILKSCDFIEFINTHNVLYNF